MPDYKKIEFSQLSKADVIFTTARDSSISATIRKATNSIISHTMLVSRYGFIIDSTASGVQERQWENDASQHVTLAIVMRRDGLSRAADQDKVVEAAKSFLYLPYDHLGAVGSGMHGNKRNQILAGAGCVLSFPIGSAACAITAAEVYENQKDENADKKFFCSELVSRSFSKAGFPIVDGRATDQTPQMVFTSTRLRYVGHLLDIPPKGLTEEEKARNRRAGYRKDAQ